MSSYAAMNAPPPDEDERAMSEINTTPLVDVMLVLLIVFMITIPVITHTVPLELPQVRNLATQTKPENVNISVNRDGQIFWNLTLVPDTNALLERLKTRCGAEAATRSPRACRPDDALRVRRARDPHGAAGRHPESGLHHGARRRRAVSR